MSNTPHRLPRLLTIVDTAEYLHVSPKTVRRILRKGELPFHEIGNQIRIAEPDLAAHLAERKK